jgi:4,5-dihydroxyphthalate decarboxylase
MAKYVAMHSQGDASLVAIPVFPSRIYRLSAVYVKAGSPIAKAADLAGKRVGIPEWAQTAVIYARGWLAHDMGVDLTSIDWYQAGIHSSGRLEFADLRLPKGVRLTPVPESSLDEMLSKGDIDAVIAASPPSPFFEGSAVHLIDNFRAVEEAYWEKTGIFPIMHVIAIRREVVDRHPWVPKNILNAFEEAKRNSLRRFLDAGCSWFPLPLGYAYADEARERYGADFWPYGVEANRITLEAFCRYAFEQGVCHRQLTVEELFPESVQSSGVT